MPVPVHVTVTVTVTVPVVMVLRPRGLVATAITAASTTVVLFPNRLDAPILVTVVVVMVLHETIALGP